MDFPFLHTDGLYFSFHTDGHGESRFFFFHTDGLYFPFHTDGRGESRKNLSYPETCPLSRIIELSNFFFRDIP